ncbi:MAG: PulJ/GspJ family protein, partial [Planctomycetota bacterium]
MRGCTSGRRGFTLIETLIAASVLALVFFAAFSHLTSIMRRGKQNTDRVFGYERALSIMEELRAFGRTEENEEAAHLDQ